MILERWRLFVRIADAGSLSKVAASLNTVQSVVSRQLASLEKACGGRLFDRTGRGVVLTDIGQRIYPRVKILIQELDQLTAEIRADSASPKGVVSLGIIPSMAHPLVDMLFRQIRMSFPGVQLRVVSGSSGQLREWLAAGQLDIAILFRYGRDAASMGHTITQVDSCLVGRAGDALTRSPTVKFAQLHNIPLVLSGSSNTIRAVLEKAAKRKGIQLNVVLECDALSIVKNIAAEGGVYSVLWHRAIAPEVRRGSLQASCIVEPKIRRTVALCVSNHGQLSLACREISKLIRLSVESIDISRDQTQIPSLFADSR